MPEGPWILDTSVAAAWFFTDEPLRAACLSVRTVLLERPDRFAVPHLVHSELVHVLTRKSGRDMRFVDESLQLFLRLGLRTLPLTEAALLRTGHWACKGMSGYDATFVALAEDLGGEWLTADDRAARLAGAARAVTVSRWARTRG